MEYKKCQSTSIHKLLQSVSLHWSNSASTSLHPWPLDFTQNLDGRPQRPQSAHEELRRLMKETRRRIKSNKSIPKQPGEVCRGWANVLGSVCLCLNEKKGASAQLTRWTAVIKSNEANESNQQLLGVDRERLWDPETEDVAYSCFNKCLFIYFFSKAVLALFAFWVWISHARLKVRLLSDCCHSDRIALTWAAPRCHSSQNNAKVRDHFQRIYLGENLTKRQQL